MVNMTKPPRFPNKATADAYHFIVEETDDKKDYEIGDRFYKRVSLSYYDCYIYVRCKRYFGAGTDKFTFAKKSKDYIFISSVLVEDNEPE
jgi:hypothetical protein